MGAGSEGVPPDVTRDETKGLIGQRFKQLEFRNLGRGV